VKLDELAKSEGIKYSKHGKMEYNPLYHFNHKQPLTEDEKEYICKYIEIDGPKNLSLALGRTEKTITTIASRLRKEGLFENYRKMDKYYISVN